MGVITRNIRRAVTWYAGSTGAQVATVAGINAVASRKAGSGTGPSGSVMAPQTGTETTTDIEEDDVELGSERGRSRKKNKGRRSLMAQQSSPEQAPASSGTGLQI